MVDEPAGGTQGRGLCARRKRLLQPAGPAAGGWNRDHWRPSSIKTLFPKTPAFGSVLKLVSAASRRFERRELGAAFEPLIGVGIGSQGGVRTRMKMALSALPDRYALPSRPATAQPTVQDAFRQTQFLLSGDLDLFEKMMNLQLQIVKANSRLRTPEAGALFSFLVPLFLAHGRRVHNDDSRLV